MHLQHPKFPKFTLVIIGVFLVAVLFLVGGASALSFTGRILFVLFLPGFSILQVAVSNEFDFIEKLILSPIIGIAFTSLIALYLSAVSIPINELTVIMSVLLLSVPLLAYSWKRGGLRKTSFKLSTAPSTYFILTLLMVSSIVLISAPFPENGILVPVGDDPTSPTLVATMIIQQGKIPQSWSPYFPEQTSFTYPPAYPSVLVFLYLLDPLCSIPVLAVFFAAFFTVIHGQIFVLTRKISRDNRIALCAAAFSALLSFGFYKMINNGRFPALVGVALTLNLIIFSYLYSITGKRKLLLISGISLASLFLTYSLAFLTAALFVILFFSLRLVLFERKKESLFGGATTIIMGIALAAPWVFNILNRLMLEMPTREYEAMLTWFDVYSVQGEIGAANPFIAYGYWLLLFGVLGVLIISVRKRSGNLLLAWFLSIFLLMLNEIVRIQFPGWYYLQSWTFLNPKLSLPLSVLAGIGLVKAYDFYKTRLRKGSLKRIKTKRYFAIVASLLLVIVMLGSAMIVFVTPEINLTLKNIQLNRISTADYNAMMWISNNTPEDAVIFNDYWIGTPSIWIPIITHRRIIMPLLSISEVGWTDIMLARQDECYEFSKNPHSIGALSFLHKYNVSYLYFSNQYSAQVEEWRDNYDAQFFLQGSHYELAFNEDNAWVIRVIY
jgi:hypothetical protein